MPDLGATGVRAGHATGAASGLTVLLAPHGTVGSGEVRGGAPATREWALLDPLRTVARVDAVLFTGGSAFGLGAADGVMRFLAARGQGFETAAGPVPIVPAAAVFDLAGAPGAREIPDADRAHAAAEAALLDGPLARGRVGAGTAATVGKWRGREYGVPGGLGVATGHAGGAQVAALAVVNAVGDVVREDGTVLAGSTAPPGAPAFPARTPFEGTNTTLVAVATDAEADKVACHLLAQSAHDGLARALRPAHSRFDGDLAIVLATGRAPFHLDRLRAAVPDLVAEAVRDAVTGGGGAPRG